MARACGRGTRRAAVLSKRAWIGTATEESFAPGGHQLVARSWCEVDTSKSRSYRSADRFTRTHLRGADSDEILTGAIREAVLNALVHRDHPAPHGAVTVAIFDDHIEVTSPGALRFSFTPEMLFRPHAAVPPNPTLAHTVYRSGLVRAWGSGFNRMVCQEAGLHAPVVTDAEGSVTVTFQRREMASTNLG